MADIAKSGTPSLATIQPGYEHQINGLVAGEAIAAGDLVYIKSDGKAWLADGSADDALAEVAGIVLQRASAGDGVTILHGIVAHYGASLTPGAPVYLSVTAGAIADAPSVGGRNPIGMCVDATRIYLFPTSAASIGAAAGGVIAITDDLMAASVDEWMFVADRAYKVMGFQEVHSVVGGSGAVVRPRKVTAAGTDAPGDAAGATVKELTTANIDLTATANVTQAPALTATAADLLLAAGDKVGLNYGGTLTGLVGKLIMFLQPI